MTGAGEAVAIASCCLNCCCKQFNQYIFDAERNMSDLRMELLKLAAVRGDVAREVEATKQRGQPATAAENWVARSISLDGAAQKLLSDREAMCLPRLNLWSRYNIGKRAVRKLLKARELVQEKPNLEAALTLTTPAGEIGLHVQEKQIESAVVGMDPYLEKALEHISSATVGVIGICGMGGVGKTTLLRKIHGEFLPGKAKRKMFDKVVWAVVYKKSITAGNELESDVARLQNDIAKQLGLELDKEPADDRCPREVLELRAQPIYEYLRNKSFLVLLDDLWRPLELKSIGVPNPSPADESQRKKHKLVLTSRSRTVCSQMQAAPGLISVRCLNKADAWRLFEFNATSQTVASHQAIRNLAREVMAECQGLPLALNTIGKALSSKSGDPNPWRDVLRKLKEARHVEIAGMEAVNAAMLHRLKISYDCLPSERDKDCLLSCCLWPEDYSIDKVKLTECWLGLGIINCSPSSSSIDTGMSIITSLEEAHLLQPGDDEATQVKMHDSIRDMSLWISSDCGKMKSKWLVKAGVGLKTAQRVVEQLQEASADTERVSLMGNAIEELPSAIPHLPSAKVLMLQRNEALRVVPGTFLRSAPTLTYMDLSNTGVEEIPGEISLLHGLEYLNLSESQIKKLPNELSTLTKLRYLLAGGTVWLKTIPYGIVSSLKQLQTLDVFGSQYAAWAWDSDSDKPACLEEFEAKSTFLKWLGITLGSVQVLRKLAMCNNVRTRRLCLRKMHSPDPLLHVQPSILQGLLGRLDILKSLQTFKAESCGPISEVLIDCGNESGDNSLREYYCLPMLEKLELIGMNKLEHILFHRITAREFFPRLQSVTITMCRKLRNLNWALHLPELLHLELQFCSAIAALIEDTDTEHPTNKIEEEQATFPVLKTVTIHSLVSLTSLCRGRSISFPALEVLEITQCKNLSQLSIRPQSKLREIRGGEDWWQRLQWNEPSVHEELLPYFRAQVEIQ